MNFRTVKIVNGETCKFDVELDYDTVIDLLCSNAYDGKLVKCSAMLVKELQLGGIEAYDIDCEATFVNDEYTYDSMRRIYQIRFVGHWRGDGDNVIFNEDINNIELVIDARQVLFKLRDDLSLYKKLETRKQNK